MMNWPLRRNPKHQESVQKRGIFSHFLAFVALWLFISLICVIIIMKGNLAPHYRGSNRKKPIENWTKQGESSRSRRWNLFPLDQNEQRTFCVLIFNMPRILTFEWQRHIIDTCVCHKAISTSVSLSQYWGPLRTTNRKLLFHVTCSFAIEITRNEFASKSTT